MTAPAGQLVLALASPDPRRLARHGDGPGSVAAAVEVVESGQQAIQVAIVTTLVVSLPGRTSAELAEETKRMASERFGFNPARWRYVLGRRLPDAEDEGHGPIIGSEYMFHKERPWRRVDPEQAKCQTTDPPRHAIRWYPVHHPRVTALSQHPDSGSAASLPSTH